MRESRCLVRCLAAAAVGPDCACGESAVQADIDQFCAAQVCPREVRVIKAYVDELCTLEVGSAQDGVGEVYIGEAMACKVGISKVGA